MSASVRRLVIRVWSSARTRRCSTSCSKVRICALWGLSGLNRSGCVKQQLENELGVGRVVLGATGAEGLAVLGQCCGVDGEQHQKSYLRSADTMGPLSSSSARAMGLPLKRWRRLRAPSSMHSGRCSSTACSRLEEPVACKQMSCLALAQSSPMQAAKSWLGGRLRIPAQTDQRFRSKPITDSGRN